MARPTYTRVNWEDGTLISPAKVLQDDTIQEAVYQCDTPLTASNLNKMDKGISDIYEYGVSSNEVVVSDTEPTNEDTKLWINEDGVMKFKNEDDEWQGTVAGSSSLEIGTIVDLIGSTTPDGFLRTDGSTFDSSVYPELYAKNGNSNVLPLAITNFNTDITTGQETFLGYKTDGSWTYVKRYAQPFTDNSASFAHGLDLTAIKIVDAKGHYTNLSTNDFPLPSIRNSFGDYQTEFYLNGTNVEINVANQNRNGYTAYVDIYYTKNNDTFVPQYKVIKAKNIASEQTIVPDYVPIGTVLDYEGTTVPDGYEEVNRVIYESSTGQDLDLICSENPSNYDYLQFDFLHQNYHSSAIAPIINNKIQISSVGVPTGNTTIQTIVQRYTINGTTLEYDGEGMVNFENRNISWQSYDTDLTTLKVKRIIGFKI